MERIDKIANLELKANRDINEHVISCRIAKEIIRIKEEQNIMLKWQIHRLMQEVHRLKENNLKKEEDITIKDQIIKAQIELINQCYENIDNLTNMLRWLIKR